MAKAPKYILAIDQGTTGTTVNVIHVSGKSVARVNQEYKQLFPKPGWVEHRPDDIWKSVVSTLQSAFKKAKIKGTDVAAIGITNQRETVVVWERRSHKPVHNAIVWQDRRTADRCAKLKSEGLEQKVKSLTGLVLDPYFSGTKIEWILDHVNGARARAEKGELACGTIDSFLLWRLTNGESHRTDVSNASRTLLMNLDSGKWEAELLRLFRVPTERFLPEISPSSGVLGHTRGLKFLPDGIPISGMAGDQQSALFGQACFQTGESKCTFGTGSFLLMNTGRERVPSTHGMLTTAAWQIGKEPITYALEGSAFICGAAVQFLRDQLGFIKSSSEIEALARKVDSSEGVEFVPALTGMGAPYWNPNARGLICGLTRGTERAHIARATLEAMALQNAEILFAMQKDLNGKLASVRVDGGASANNLLMQIQSDYLGVEVVRPMMIETTSAGAAYLAGLGVGLWNDTSEIQKIWRVNRRFQPKLSAEDREIRIGKWNRAVQRALL